MGCATVPELAPRGKCALPISVTGLVEHRWHFRGRRVLFLEPAQARTHSTRILFLTFDLCLVSGLDLLLQPFLLFFGLFIF